MSLTLASPCKVNLLLNILGKRPDGFHELETILQPVAVSDELSFEKAPGGIALSCSNPALPCDSSNLVYKAAAAFFETATISAGVRIHLEKRIPMAAGLGGGSGNAAITLRALNELFGKPLNPTQLSAIAAKLGSDIPFFLQDNPALGEGRGERVTALDKFPAISGKWVVLIHPGFGISTPWAYKQLQQFPTALNGERGRAARMIQLLKGPRIEAAAGEFYNSLEAPALYKFPILLLYQRFFKDCGAAVSMMSGSGSSTFAIFEAESDARKSLEVFPQKFGDSSWTALVQLS